MNKRTGSFPPIYTFTEKELEPEWAEKLEKFMPKKNEDGCWSASCDGGCVSKTETSIKLGDAPLTPEARAYIAKVFPCEPPCDSYGVCDNCCEAAIFGAGYNFGYRAGMSGDTRT